MPEFHRQVVVPTAQKFSIAVLQLAEKTESPVKLKVPLLFPAYCVSVTYPSPLGSMYAHPHHNGASPPQSSHCDTSTPAESHPGALIRLFPFHVQLVPRPVRSRLALGSTSHRRQSPWDSGVEEKRRQRYI